ncbi:TonB-dependent receptor domain-containing protein [Pedobacter sp.]|uniref:TonB-dependent receptor domain-containing protein n=1 Tax=Pedobacter sp. TaxID=1411316 RepID=UPI00396CD4FD
MKKLILLFVAVFMILGAKAQFPMAGGAGAPKITGRISATVIDSATKQPIEYATVSLVKKKDNKTVNGSVTDAKGKVSLQNITPDEYKLVIGFIGYTAKSVEIKTTPEKPDGNVGTVELKGSANTLSEVTIEGKKSMIENKIDRMVYNAEADATNAGGDATDVMRKVPMLSVDINGNVQLRGSSVKVLINGKPSGTMANSVADALKMIPADQIKSVEVITSPSAKYDAEGSGGIINIITKKSNAQGVSGSANASAGTRQNTGNFNLTAKTGRLSMNTAVGAMYAYPQGTRVVFYNRTQANGTTNSVLQDGTSDWTREMINGSLGLDYDFNAYNNISTNAKYNRFYNGGPGHSQVDNNGAAATITSKTDVSMGNLDWNLDYRKTSKRQGEEFSVSGQLTSGRNTNDFSNDYQMVGFPGIISSASSNVGKNYEYTAQTDYVYPFSKTVIFETGAKGIFRNILSKYSVNSTKDFNYHQNVGAAYGTIAFNLTKKLKLKGGLRAEYTAINFDTDKNDYFNLFPSVILSQEISAMSSVKLSYNRRVQRPSLAYLNPFLNESNQFSVMKGNPTLDPELSDNVELGYSTFLKGGSMINASVFYRRTNGIIENYNLVYDKDPTKILTTYENVGISDSYGFNLFGSYNPLPKWTLMGNVGLNTYQIDNKLTHVKSDVFYNYNFFLRSATSFKQGWNLEFFGVATSPRRTSQGKTDGMIFYGAAVKKEILNKKGSIGLNVLNPFTENLHIKMETTSADSYQTQNIYYPLRSFGINFSYSFGKLKFTEKKKIKNDDIKQDQQQQGGGQMGGMGQ